MTRALLSCSVLLIACSSTRELYIGSDRDRFGQAGVSSAGSAGVQAEDAAPSLEAGPTEWAAPDASEPAPPDDCVRSRRDCDGDAANGCETDTSQDRAHCGGCDRACHTNGHDAIAAVCTAGRCVITCEAELFGEQDCDGVADNGCETELTSDPNNCGMCGVQCSGFCSNGACL